MDSPLISVIIPVYKTEKYLDRCVASVVGQTYKNLEIILVDDGSPDRCPEMCDEWAAKDSRIKVIHKENGGAADAKNVGLDSARGAFIAIFDSDDTAAPEMYESLMKLIVEYDADIADSLAEKTYSEGAIDYRSNNDTSVTVYTAQQALSELIKDRTVRQTPWNKIYKASVVGDIRFPKGRYIDDEYWTYRVIGNSVRYVFTDAVYYYYMQHSESAMGRSYSLKRLDALDALMDRCSYIKERFPNIVPEAEGSYFGSCRFHFQMLCYYKELDPDKIYRKGILSRIASINTDRALSTYKGKRLRWAKAFLRAPYLTSKIRNLFKIGW